MDWISDGGERPREESQGLPIPEHQAGGNRVLSGLGVGKGRKFINPLLSNFQESEARPIRY